MWKKCPNCGQYFETHDSSKRFCNLACYEEWRARHARRSPAANRARCRRLLMRYIHGDISEEEFERKKRLYKKYGLWYSDEK